jgi:hypothetical protein
MKSSRAGCHVTSVLISGPCVLCEGLSLLFLITHYRSLLLAVVLISKVYPPLAGSDLCSSVALTSDLGLLQITHYASLITDWWFDSFTRHLLLTSSSS